MDKEMCLVAQLRSGGDYQFYGQYKSSLPEAIVRNAVRQVNTRAMCCLARIGTGVVGDRVRPLPLCLGGQPCTAMFP